MRVSQGNKFHITSYMSGDDIPMNSVCELGVFPKANVPDSTIVVFDVSQCSVGEKHLLVSLQGLVNRHRPGIYLVWDQHERLWLDWYKQKGYISDFEEVDSIANVVELFEWAFKGLVKAKWADTTSINVAQMLGSIEDCLIFIPDSDVLNDFESRYTVYHDLTGRFSSNVEAYRWAYDNLWAELNHDLAALKHATSLASRDYAIANRLFTFWISGEKDGQLPGASQHEETMFARMLFQQLPPNSPIMGYPYAGEGIGPGEGGGVSLVTEYGKFIACDSPNLTVHSGIRTLPLKQSSLQRSICPKLENDKVYISFIISDGDNMNCWDVAHLPLWNQNSRGKIPVSWNLMPGLYDLMPGIIEYYYETASEHDEFIAAGAGIGYANPYKYGSKVGRSTTCDSDEESVLEAYISKSVEYMKALDLSILNPYHLGYIIDHQNVDVFNSLKRHLPVAKELLHTYVRLNPELKGIFPDYARTPGMTYPMSHYFVCDIPVFHSLSTHFWPSKGKDEDIKDKVRELIEVSRGIRPAFINVFMVNWCFGPDDINTICTDLGDEFVPVLPSHLVQLARERRKEER